MERGFLQVQIVRRQTGKGQAEAGWKEVETMSRSIEEIREDIRQGEQLWELSLARRESSSSHRQLPGPGGPGKPQLGKSAGKRNLDLSGGGNYRGASVLLQGSGPECEGNLRNRAGKRGFPGNQRHDARLYGLRGGRKPSRALQDLEKYHDRGGGREADEALFLQHSPEMEHRPSVSGHAEWGRAPGQAVLSDNPGRVYSLAPHRGEGAGRR